MSFARDGLNSIIIRNESDGGQGGSYSIRSEPPLLEVPGRRRDILSPAWFKTTIPCGSQCLLQIKPDFYVFLGSYFSPWRSGSRVNLTTVHPVRVGSVAN